jgi:hypothetical protein
MVREGRDAVAGEGFEGQAAVVGVHRGWHKGRRGGLARSRRARGRHYYRAQDCCRALHPSPWKTKTKSPILELRNFGATH